MEVQIDTLIEKVKEHGIVEGEKQAAILVENAKKEATQIIALAQQEANNIITDATKQADVLQKRGKDALNQAHRDLLLTVKEDVKRVLSVFVSEQTHKVMTSESLKELLVKVLSSWKFENNANIFVTLSDLDAKTILQEVIQGAVKSQNGTVAIKGSSSISGGFRVTHANDGTLEFDFTDKNLSESLMSFLTPKLREILK